MKNKRFFTLILFLLLTKAAFAQLSVSNTKQNTQQFPLASKYMVSGIYVGAAENILVHKAAQFLASDMEMVTGKKPDVNEGLANPAKNVVIIGTIDNSKIITDLVKRKKINVDEIKGRWEGFMIQTVSKPFPGVEKALVIVGSDRRGAAFGTFTVSESIGVSPWYWWADVPVKKNAQIYMDEVRYVSKGPAVKYRGIFINDESPAFRYWAFEKFGGINHQCYEKIFELLLRQKANFLWPSMWLPTMFNVDDPLNPKTADEFGIVMSTSHHEPMMRAHNEWSLFNGGVWDYTSNREKLQEFWRGGIERMDNYESVVTVGMRGDGDAGMSEETAVDLLKEVVKDQRKIISEVTGKPAETVPQVWAIYKEVQDYYDKGMRVDDDITVLFSDDNWGNIRYLPKKELQGSKKKYGMYYHVDYVGAPVSYRWQNVTQIERIWQQMKLTYEHGVKDLWIVNVGDIKPMELPISFFMDYAWDPDAIKAKGLPVYYHKWAEQQFGAAYATEIAEIMALYTKYNARRTPEMLKPDTYSMENFREADRIVAEYKALVDKSETLYNKLGREYKDAFYQLVLSPIKMCANLNEMYVCAGKNRYYAERGAAAANFYADRTKELFDNDKKLTEEYHKFNNGKWNHMMSQTHIGYTNWNHPPLNAMPAVSYVQVPEAAELGYLIEYGKKPVWGWLDVEADWDFSSSFPIFDPLNNQSFYIDIINRGQKPLSYTVKALDPWIILSSTSGTTQFNDKVYASIDWGKLPNDVTTGHISVSGAGKEYEITVPVRQELPKAAGFIEDQGTIAFEATHYTNSVNKKNMDWEVVPNLGRTGDGLLINAVKSTQEGSKPCFEYKFTLLDATENVEISTYLSPLQDFLKGGGLKFALSIDGREPEIININEGEDMPDYKYAPWWSKSVGDHIKIKTLKVKGLSSGTHILKVWPMDSAVVFQKFVIETGRGKDSYLGAPESVFIK